MYLRILWILALSLQLAHGKVIQESEKIYSFCSPSDLAVGSAQYTKDITSWSLTNVEHAVCTVEPSTSKDVSKIVSIFLIPSRRCQLDNKANILAQNLGIHQDTICGTLLEFYRIFCLNSFLRSRAVVIR